MSIPNSLFQDIPTITTEQMIEVDRLMIEEYQIELIQMMENAGRCLAILARDRFLVNKKAKVCVLAGTGGNGGGALVSARRLMNQPRPKGTGYLYRPKAFLSTQESGN